jgi:hypothetical protein
MEPAAGQTLSNFIVPDKVFLFISQESPGYKGKRRVSLNFGVGRCRFDGLILSCSQKSIFRSGEWFSKARKSVGRVSRAILGA